MMSYADAHAYDGVGVDAFRFSCTVEVLLVKNDLAKPKILNLILFLTYPLDLEEIKLRLYEITTNQPILLGNAFVTGEM